MAMTAPRKILIVCSHYWPSVGGLEVSMGQLSVELVAAGYPVTVLTQAFPGRSGDSHAGVRIISIGQREFPWAIREAVGSGAFDVCVLVQDPLGVIIWSVEGLQAPTHVRVLIQPIINEDGYARWKDHREFRQRLAAILKAADAVLVMTRSGPDVRYMQEAGIDFAYLPNATTEVAPAGDFRGRFGIAQDRFMILHVANLYPVKNHVGLIDALQALPPDWQLVMIGHPAGSAEYVNAVGSRLAARPDILFIPGLPPEWISAAMGACDVKVLASHGEGSPITLLEAMVKRKPWLATPHCGAANDHLGGFIAELGQFRAVLGALARDTSMREELGRISYQHWTRCHAWKVVLQGWIDLIESGRLRRDFNPDAGLGARMQTQRLRLAHAIGSSDRG
jgi:glycosyltransferase involved in cell wall biosynthesis